MQTNQFLKRDHFLLGTFSTNCSGGMTVSKLPNRWKADWESNLKIGKLLDEAGIDFMLPIARWIGYGGESPRGGRQTNRHHAAYLQRSRFRIRPGIRRP
jgi:hypothetical protein